MRILFDATNIINQPTGAGVYAFNILKSLSNIGNRHNITVLVREELSPENDLFTLPFEFIKKDIPTLGLKRELKLPFLLRNLKDKYDLFFTFMPYLSLINCNVNLVITIHDLAFLRYPHIAKTWFHKVYFKLLMKRSIKQARHIFTVSKSSEKDIVKFFKVDKNKISIAYPDSNLEKKNYKSDVKKKRENYFLFVGEKREHKNIDSMVKAFAEFRKNNNNFKFILAGRSHSDKYTKKLEKLIKELNLTDNVIMLGSVDQKELAGLYKNAFALVFVSSYEGFGIPVLEAMRVGVPVITSDVYSMPEAGGGAVLYSDPKDIESIKNNMTRLITDKNLYQELVEKGTEQEEKFSWKKSAIEILKYLDGYEQARQ